jgi:hypothetical protein
MKTKPMVLMVKERGERREERGGPIANHVPPLFGSGLDYFLLFLRRKLRNKSVGIGGFHYFL